jgi:sugar lactone lactonase YvrE
MSEVTALAAPASRLGESPLWHPQEQRLYWCDIPGRRVHRFDPATERHTQWDFDSDVGCIAPWLDGGLLLALRSGLVLFDPANGDTTPLVEAPYETGSERFNDGKADPLGRLWVGTIYEPREPALAALYCFADGELTRMADGITVSNGLAWSPDARTMYWSDTKAHTVYMFDFDVMAGSISNRREFARFAVREPEQPLADYGGRPDGAAVDAEGCYWVAMYEGARLLRLSPAGAILRELPLPVRCPTMPCFGGPDMKTLFITTACDKRPADELAAEPLAGRVLTLRVDVPGLPAHLARS